MGVEVAKELAALNGMAVKDLRQRYVAAFVENPHTRHYEYIVKRIICRVRAMERGRLSVRAR